MSSPRATKVTTVMAGGWRVAADVGGTFTDIILATPAGEVRTTKILSTPPDFGRAVLEGVRELTREVNCDPRDIARIVHATTVATNGIIERSGPRTGLITTAGFRDILELRRIRFRTIYFGTSQSR